MKINKILSICVIAALLGSCSDNLELEYPNSPENTLSKTIRIGVSLQNNESRMAYQENEDSYNLLWDENDTLKVLNPSRNKDIIKFHLVSGAGQTFAEFEGEVTDDYAVGDTLYALYHNTLITTEADEDGNVSIDMSNQDGTLKDDFQIMYGRTVYTGEDLQAIKMNHLASIIKLTIPTNVTLTEIVIDNQGEPYRTNGTLVLQNSPSNSSYKFDTGEIVYYNGDDSNDEHRELKLSGSFVPENDTITAYYYLLQTRNYNGSETEGVDIPHLSPTFKAKDEVGNVYYSANYFYPKTSTLGTVKEVTSSLFKMEDFAGGEGTSDNPFKISTKDQLYSFMMHCYYDNQEDTNYSSKCYELGNDIDLDGSVYWRRFNFSGVFDGKGYTISGQKNNMFFEYLNKAVISNLILDLEITFKHYHYTNFGILACNANDETQIINCVNKSNINIEPHDRIAGSFVGSLSSHSKMIACVNLGSIYVENPNFIGGLVGRLDNGAEIEGCYNKGEIHVEVGDDRTTYLGDLVGAINYEMGDNADSANMRSCWNSSSIYYTGSNVVYNNFSGYGASDYCKNCFNIEGTPTEEQIKDMNDAMTNELYKFGTNGEIIAKSSSGSGTEQ